MSEANAFDTHRFVKNLTASDFTEVQAEALAAERMLLDQRLFNVDETRFNAFKAMLDSPVEPGEILHKTLTASPPWEA